VHRAGLDRSTLVVAGVTTPGLMMAASTGRSSTTRWTRCRAICTHRWRHPRVSTAYLLSLAVVIPLPG